MHLEREQPFSVENVAAVRLCRTPFGNLHAGLAYSAHGKVKEIHLGWQDTLQTDWERFGYWATPTVDPLLLKMVPGKCRRIIRAYKKSKKFPYGLAYQGAKFNKSGSPQVRGHAVSGLSCTTFAIAVFESVGVRLIDPETWPVRKDEDVEHVRSLKPACAKHPGLFERLLSEVEGGVVRVRPKELLGACCCAPDADFDAACNAVKEVELPSMRVEMTSETLKWGDRSVLLTFEVTKDPNSATPDAYLFTPEQSAAAQQRLHAAWMSAYGEAAPPALVAKTFPGPPKAPATGLA